MTVTIEDIEKQVHDNFAVRIAMNSCVNKLKEAEKDLGKDSVHALIMGRRRLSAEEFAAAVKKFGLTGVKQIEAMENLTAAQKGYLCKRLGYE